MNWSATVLSSVSSDTEPTIVINFESAKYIFNAGENTTRTFLQSRQTWRKAKALFLSRVCTERAAGVPGFLMTLADNGINHMSIIGPEGLLHYLASMRLYTYRENMTVTPIEVASLHSLDMQCPPVYTDDNITAFAIPVLPSVKPLASTLKRKRSATFGEGGILKRRSNDEYAIPLTPTIAPCIPVPSDCKDTLSDQAPSGDQIPILQRFSSPSFSPSTLTPSDAVEWRKVTIGHMFGRYTLAGVDQDVKNSDVRPPQVNRKAKNAFNPAGSAHLLPRWIPSHVNQDVALRQNSLDVEYRVASSFIVRGPKPRGKFDAKKAASLGLGSGPLRGKVARGETVEIIVKTADGGEEKRRIGPEDCLGPAGKISVLCVIDCPTTSYIEGIVTSPNWGIYLSKEGRENGFQVHVIFHLVGDEVLEDQRYVDWMKSFDKSTHHLIASRKYCQDPVTFTSAAYAQLRLNRLDSDMFPLPFFNLNSPSKSLSHLSMNSQPMSANQVVELRPLKAPVIDKLAAEKDLFHPAVLSSKPLTLPLLTADKFKEVQAIVNATQGDLANVLGDVIVIPLGTSSSMPSKYRNVSSTFIHIPDYGNILLDCGEGTWGQLVRHFGSDLCGQENVFDVLRKLKCIFISHIHGDHHIGLSKILIMRKRLRPRPLEPLYLVADRAVHMYLKEYSDLEDLNLDKDDSGSIRTILTEAVHWKRKKKHNNTPNSGHGTNLKGWMGNDAWTSISKSEIAAQELQVALGLESFQAVDVIHRTRCHGVVFKHREGWSIVYSGDTMPSKNLVQAGKDATLLIHEATMADDEADLAERKAHSTFGQAVDAGKRMSVQNTLLTHFSARYPKMPPFLSDPNSNNHPILGLALDHARLPLHSMWKLSKYLPAIEQSFADVEEKGEEEEGNDYFIPCLTDNIGDGLGKWSPTKAV